MKLGRKFADLPWYVPVVGTIYAIFAKIGQNYCLCPLYKAERAPLQNLLWDTPKKHFGNVDSKAEDNRAWEINLFKYSVNFLSAYFHIQEIQWIFK